MPDIQAWEQGRCSLVIECMICKIVEDSEASRLTVHTANVVYE